MVSNSPVVRGFGSRKEYKREAKTLCRECPVRCGLVAYLKDGEIVDIHGDKDHPVSRGRLCARGIAFVQGLRNPQRITSPGLRKKLGDSFEEPKDWEMALDVCAESLRKTRDQYGAESIAIGCDCEADLEFAVGAARFAKRLGTPHVYVSHHLVRAQHAFAQPSYPVPPCHEWGKSKCILFIEADMAVTHTVAFGWALEAQRQGATIIAADARFTRTLSKADLTLRILPRSGNLVGLALMKMMLEEASHGADIRMGRCADAEKEGAFSAVLSGEDFENLIGLTHEDLRKVNSLLRGNGPGIIVTGEELATLPHYGIWPAFRNAMDRIGAAGTGWYPLYPATPPLDPCQGMEGGDVDFGNGGLDLKKVFASSKAVLCSGNFLGDVTPSSGSEPQNPDLVVYFGAFPNATRDISHLVLPSTLWPEKSSICFSADQEIQWGEKILEPRAGCRSSLDLWVGLAKRFGWQEDFPWTKADGSADPFAFCQWLLDSSPATKGCKADRLWGAKGITNRVFWPLNGYESEGVKVDPTLISAPLESSSRSSDEDGFPLYFQKIHFISRSEEAGRWWPGMQNLEQEDGIQIHPKTAGALGIETGDEILVTGPYGTLRGRAWVSRMVPPWMVSAPGISVGEKVLVQKPERTREETLAILRELLQ